MPKWLHWTQRGFRILPFPLWPTSLPPGWSDPHESPAKRSEVQLGKIQNSSMILHCLQKVRRHKKVSGLLWRVLLNPTCCKNTLILREQKAFVIRLQLCKNPPFRQGPESQFPRICDVIMNWRRKTQKAFSPSFSFHKRKKKPHNSLTLEWDFWTLKWQVTNAFSLVSDS